MLRLIDIEKSYTLGAAEIDVLRRVNLKIREGDLLSITGPSGSGKTTLMNVLGLLSQPTAGTYLLRGQDVSSMDDDTLSAFRQRAHRLRVPVLQPDAAPDGPGEHRPAAGLPRPGPGEIARRSRAMLEKVGMKGRSRHLPSQLSGGQRQRVAIARALVGEPAVILADEPTGTLDSGAAREVMELLVELNARDRITVVIITHDDSIARRCARHTRLMDGVLREGPLGRP